MTATLAQDAGRITRLGMLLPSRFAPFAWQELPVRDEFAKRHALQGPSVLHARCALLGTTAEVRTVTIRGGHAEVFNLLVFPHEPQALPLLVAEVFALRGQVKVAFFDMPYVGTDEQAHARIATEQQTWPTDERPEAPAWATTFSTGGYLYQRDLNDASGLEERLHQTVTSWLNVHDRQPTRGPHRPHHLADQRLTQFKREHVEQAPNLGFLGAFFGHDWAARFMNDFLYR